MMIMMNKSHLKRYFKFRNTCSFKDCGVIKFMKVKVNYSFFNLINDVLLNKFTATYLNYYENEKDKTHSGILFCCLRMAYLKVRY